MTLKEHAERLHEDACYAPPERYWQVIMRHLENAVIDEREACARLAEEAGCGGVALSIRARTDQPPGIERT